MEKKHRDIVVGGQQYGWIVKFTNILHIYQDKKLFFTIEIDNFDDITPIDVADAIKKHNKKIKEFELNETLAKEWTAFLDKIPWEGYGSSVEESNYIFAGKRKAWMKKMMKKHDVGIDTLEKLFNNNC